LTQRLLFIDIETLPAKVVVFQLWKPVIGMDQILEPSRIGGFSYRWYGEKKARWLSEHHDGADAMHDKLWELLDEADIVIGYNSQRFDTPWITGELILRGKTPPSPFRQIDLYRVSRQHMRLLSGKLDYLSLRLLEDRKVKHEGIGLWKACLEGDGAAWNRMRRYGLKDTDLMIPIYEILRPWIKTHPNLAVGSEEAICTRCESTDLQRRGFDYRTTGSYQRYVCKSCGGWMTGSHRVATTALRSA